LHPMQQACNGAWGTRWGSGDPRARVIRARRPGVVGTLRWPTALSSFPSSCLERYRRAREADSLLRCSFSRIASSEQAVGLLVRRALPRERPRRRARASRAASPRAGRARRAEPVENVADFGSLAGIDLGVCNRASRGAVQRRDGESEAKASSRILADQISSSSTRSGCTTSIATSLLLLTPVSRPAKCGRGSGRRPPLPSPQDYCVTALGT
jgi:hypothetical protein